MSGTTIADPPQNSTQQTASEDAAAELRAAALRTLKRRKLNSNANADLSSTLPPRPVLRAAPSIQLDYGQAEPSSAPRATSSVVPTTSVDTSTPMDVDDSQAREEGEISDTESTPPPPVKPPATDLPKSKPIALKPDLRNASPPPPVISFPAPRGPPVIVKTESIPLSISDLSPIRASVPPTHTSPSGLPFDPDSGYVRPGLSSACI